MHVSHVYMRSDMKLLAVASLVASAAFALSVNAAETVQPTTSAEPLTSTVQTTKSANAGGSITETVETIKGDASTIKSHVKDGNYTELVTDKQKLDGDVNTAKEQIKSFSFGSGQASPAK